jgi:hypothetical protein
MIIIGIIAGLSVLAGAILGVIIAKPAKSAKKL